MKIKTMNKLFVLAACLLGTTAAASLYQAYAQDCSGMTSYMINANGNCIDVSNLETQASSDEDAEENTRVTVDTLVDESDGNFRAGDLSLREAIDLVAEGGIIDFDPRLAEQDVGFGQGTIGLELGSLLVEKSLTIQGLGADKLIVSGLQELPFPPPPVSDRFSVFTVGSAGGSLDIDVVIDGLTITGGTGGNGGGIENYQNLKIRKSLITGNSSGDGGGIHNRGSGNLQVSDTTVSNNGSLDRGGGILNFGYLVVVNSAIIDNSTFLSVGGGISNLGTAIVINTTIAGNDGGDSGGGIANGEFDQSASGIVGTLFVQNSTIVGNFSGNAFFGGGEGGIANLVGAATVENSIIAANINPSSNLNNDVAGPFISDGFNLIGNGDFATGFIDGVSGDQVGDSTQPLDLFLGPLADNGGPTLTQALLPGSPALNAGDPNFTPPPKTDQRGLPRIALGRLDIGAFEFQGDKDTEDE